MKDPSPHRGVIPASTVRRLAQTVVVDCSSTPDDTGSRSLTIIPLVDGDLIAGLEIRCTCGSSAIVECVYDGE